MGFLDFPLYNLSSTDATLPKAIGQGEKRVMIIVNESENQDKLDFVYSVFAPLDFQPGDVFVILVTTSEIPGFAQLSRNYDFDRLILFGVNPAQLGVQILPKPYLPIKLLKKELLFADEVDVFLEEKSKGGGRPKAKQLWLALKSFLTK